MKKNLNSYMNDMKNKHKKTKMKKRSKHEELHKNSYNKQKLETRREENLNHRKLNGKSFQI